MNTATVFLFKRTSTASPPSVPSTDLTYTFSIGFLAGDLDGWTQALSSSGGSYRWVTSARVASETTTGTVVTSAWGVAALLAEDGDCRYTATVYKQVALDPGSPVATASSYNFATGTLTPPSGWAVSQPTTTTVNTWAVDYTFVGLDTETVTGIGYWGPTKIVSVAGINGQNIYVVAIYKQTIAEIITPTGGSYKFDGDVFVAPLGWSRTMPTVSETPIYMSVCRFSSNNALATNPAIQWSYPVVIARTGSDFVNRFKSICFLYAADTPATPAGGSYSSPIPTGLSGWQDGIPPYEAGKDLWMTSQIFFADGSNNLGWSDPVKMTVATESSKLQFSINGTDWHDTPDEDDVYMRSGTNNGSGWQYTGVVRIKGEAGPTGETGTPGTPGTILYTWIAYAYDLGGVNGFTIGSPTTDHKCIGVAINQTTSEEGTNPYSYTWSNWGVEGQTGSDGLTTFTWFAYANSADGELNFTTGAWTDQTYIGLAFNKLTPIESEDFADYSWSKMAGTTAQFIRITASSTFFNYPVNTAASNKTITLEAELFNGLYDFQWEYYANSTWIPLGNYQGLVLAFSGGTVAGFTEIVNSVILLGDTTVPTGTANHVALTQTTPFTAPSLTVTTNAAVYLSGSDNFVVSNGNVKIYGSTGNNEITVNTGALGITADQNIDRINFPLAVTNYKFKQTGNLINIYNSLEQLIIKLPVQGDADGTRLSFNGTYSDVIFATGGLTLGGTAVSSTIIQYVTPSEIATIPSAASSTSTGAKVYLGSGTSHFTVNQSGMIIYGNRDYSYITLADGVTNIVLDQNIEAVILPNAITTYTFKQTGNLINVYADDTTTLIYSLPVQPGTEDDAATYVLADKHPAWDNQNSLQVRCISDTVSDTLTIYKSWAGDTNVIVSMPNANIVLPANSLGIIEDYSKSGGVVYVEQGAQTLQYDAACNGTVGGKWKMSFVSESNIKHGSHIDSGIDREIMDASDMSATELTASATWLITAYGYDVAKTKSSIYLVQNFTKVKAALGTPLTGFNDINLTLTVPNITKLEIVNQGNADEFVGSDLKVQWAKVGALGNIEAVDTANRGQYTGWFAYYEVKILNAAGVLIHEEHLPIDITTYTYDYNTNYVHSNGVPLRTLIAEVRAVSSSILSGNKSIIPARKICTNPTPPKITTLALQHSLKSVHITFDDIQATIPDVMGYEIHISTNPTFTPNSGTCITKGRDSRIYYTVPALGTYYVRVGAYDSFGAIGILYSDPVTIVVDESTATVDLTATVTGFAYDSTGANPSPTTATITATAHNTSGDVYYEFSVDDSIVQNTTTNTYTYSAQSAYTSMPDKIIVRIREGSNSSTVLSSDQFVMLGMKAGATGSIGVAVPTAGTYDDMLNITPTVGMWWTCTDINYITEQTHTIAVGSTVKVIPNRITFYCQNAGYWQPLVGNVYADSIVGTTITGKVIQTASGTGQRITINEDSENDLRFYADLGDGSGVSLVADIGYTLSNLGTAIAIFGLYGTGHETNGHTGVTGVSHTGYGVFGGTYSGTAVSGTAYGNANYQIGVSGHSSRTSFHEGAIGVKGSAAGGFGVVAQQTSSIGAPLRIVPHDDDTAPTHSAATGAFWVTSTGRLFFCTEGSTWKLITVT